MTDGSQGPVSVFSSASRVAPNPLARRNPLSGFGSYVLAKEVNVSTRNCSHGRSCSSRNGRPWRAMLPNSDSSYPEWHRRLLTGDSGSPSGNAPDLGASQRSSLGHSGVWYVRSNS